MAVAKAQTKFCVYLGPTIRGLVQNGTIYEGDAAAVKARLAPAIERYPRIGELIVTGETLAQDRIKIRTKGNYLYEVNRKFIAELKKGV